MRSEPAFAGVVRAELRFNATRVLPWVLIAVFALNGLLWWGWGPAAARGVATNSEGFIAGILTVFSFMTAPFFTALVMADPVLRDFEVGIDALIFSKPIARARYIIAKFLGNYVVLLLCQSAFIMMLVALQFVRKGGMLVGPFVVLPFIRHFVVIVGVSHLAFAAIFFAVGTIFRSAMASYAAAMVGYFAYIGWQILLRGAPPAWRTALDPLLMNSFSQAGPRFLSSAVTYTPLEIANRLVMIGIAAGSLVLVQAVFSRRALYARADAGPQNGRLDLTTPLRRRAPAAESAAVTTAAPARATPRPVRPTFHAFAELRACLASELRLLHADRVLHFAVPIVLLLNVAAIAIYRPVRDSSVTGGYAFRVTTGLAVMLIVLVFFCAGLITHRARLLGAEALVWSTPVRSSTVILARFVTLLAGCAMTAAFTIAGTVVIQALREHGSIAAIPYVASCMFILVPALFFVSALAVLACQAIREKHAYHAVVIALAGVMYYVYQRGYQAWWYNPLHYEIWSYARLQQSAFRHDVALHGAYWVLLSALCLAAATRDFSLQRHGVTR